MKTIVVHVSDEWAAEFRRQQDETGVKPSEVARRAMCAWAISGYVPPVPVLLKPVAATLVPTKRGRPKKAK